MINREHETHIDVCLVQNYVILNIFNLYTHCGVPENIHTLYSFHKGCLFDPHPHPYPTGTCSSSTASYIPFKIFAFETPCLLEFPVFSSRKCPYSPSIRDWNFIVDAG